MEYFLRSLLSAGLHDGIIIFFTQFLCSKDYGILYIYQNYPLIMCQCRHAPKLSRILLLSLEYFGILHVSARLLDGIIIILTQFLCSKDYGILYINPNYPLIISQCRHADMVPNFPEYF